MSDYFFNLLDFCCTALFRKKQASVQTLIAFYGNRSVDSFCRKSDRNFNRCNFADKHSVTFSFCNRRNPRSDAYAWP